MPGGESYAKGLYVYGKKKHEGCSKTPQTCKLLKTFKDSSSCEKCISKLTLLKPGTSQYAHTGPANDKLRAFLPLKVTGDARLKVAKEEIKLQENEIIVIDDTFENYLVNDTDDDLILLVIDFHHPDLKDRDKKKGATFNEIVKQKYFLY